MLRNYILIAIRNILREKFYAFVNIIGLAIGLACFILISLWIGDELSYDTHFRNYERIYRIESSLVTEGVPKPMAATDRRLFNQLNENFQHVCKAVGVYSTPTLISYGRETAYQEQTFYADAKFFEIFSFDFVYGSPETALLQEGTVVLTEAVARRLFGDKNPVGQTIRINNHKTKEKSEAYVVTGVVRNNPRNSHFHPSAIFRKTGNMDTFEIVYILLNKGYTTKYFASSVWMPLYEKYFRPNYIGERQDITLDRVQPLAGIHLSGTKWEDFEKNSDRFLIYIFAAIGFLILALSCINYINLATARSFSRTREIGVRKALGAPRKLIILQFLTESIVTTFIALVLALSLVEISIPLFNQLSDKAIVLNIFDPALLVYAVLVALIVGILSGVYPAFFVSSFQPVTALRGINDSRKNKPNLRKSLVVVQFAVSIIMLLATVIIRQQLQFLKKQNLGFDTDRMLLVSLNDEQVNKRQEALKAALLSNTNVVKVTMSHNIPGGEINHTYINFETKKGMNGQLINSMFVDPDYIRVMGLKLVEGRAFDSSMTAQLDTTAFLIINESARRHLGYNTAVGKKIHTGAHYGLRKGEIIGVVKDFHAASLHQPIEPLVLALGTLGRPEGKKKYLTVKVRASGLMNTIAFIERAYKSLGQGYPFQYNFLDQEFNDQYNREEKQKTLFNAFAGMSMFSSFLGLIGLTSFITRRREKEIAVRRVSGASTVNILFLLSADFIKLVLISGLVAAPLGYFIMTIWLNRFAYHISIDVSVLIGVTAVTLLFVLLTTFVQAFFAVRKAPAVTLRVE